MTKSLANKIVRLAVQEGANVTCKGHVWIDHELISAVNAIMSSAGGKRLASDGCYVIGDVYDVIGVPRIAAKWYHAAIQIDPLHWEARREYGNRLVDLGDAEAGITQLRRSLKISKDHITVERDITLAVSMRLNNTMSSHERRLRSARLNIAQGRVSTAIRLLRSMPASVESLLHLTRAHAKVGDYMSYYATWERIKEHRSITITTPADWYYVTWNLSDMPALMSLWISMRGKWNVSSSVLPWQIVGNSLPRSGVAFQQMLRQKIAASLT